MEGRSDPDERAPARVRAGALGRSLDVGAGVGPDDGLTPA